MFYLSSRRLLKRSQFLESQPAENRQARAVVYQVNKTEIATPLQYTTVAKHWVFHVYFLARTVA